MRKSTVSNFPDPPASIIALAQDYRRRAYCPYSKFAVGAVLVGTNDEIFGGCNVENSSFSLTICAERVAMQTAVAAGVREFSYLVLSSHGAVAPCGACRQVLAEFAPKLKLFLISPEAPEIQQRHDLQELLPAAFSGSSIKPAL